MRISDWSSDVCSSDLVLVAEAGLVILHTNRDLAGLGELLHLRAGFELVFTVRLGLDVAALVVTAGVATGAQHAEAEDEPRRACDSLVPDPHQIGRESGRERVGKYV